MFSYQTKRLIVPAAYSKPNIIPKNISGQLIIGVLNQAITLSYAKKTSINQNHLGTLFRSNPFCKMVMVEKDYENYYYNRSDNSNYYCYCKKAAISMNFISSIINGDNNKIQRVKSYFLVQSTLVFVFTFFLKLYNDFLIIFLFNHYLAMRA